MRVALIDDDEAVLDSLRLYLEHKGAAVECYRSADAFLGAREDAARFDCLVADVRMPGTSGLDLVRRAGRAVPIVLITGHGDVDMAVQAIKLGAFDFIEKPFDESRLLAAIESAVAQPGARQDSPAEVAEWRERAAGLSERQRQVMEHAATGLSNKEIGQRLGISSRTVEIHRAWMMERMGAKNLAELVRMSMRLKD